MGERKATIPKKLVNDPRNCVIDSLTGFALSHSNVKLLQGCNALVRSDLNEFKEEGKVSVISGGGSGHEPFIGGYVAKGLLTASVAGDVFASPSTANITQALNKCYTDAGVLLIVVNYTGDRLQFGKAAEIAKGCGKYVDMVFVGEDCALSSKDKGAGRRGLCGTVFIYKIAGAMAEAGCPLDKIAAFLRDTAKEMGTISVSLSPCSIPGKPPSFTIADDKMEFGLGIHGEAGVAQIDVHSANAIVKKMIDHIEGSGYIPSIVGKDVAVIVNNLGGTSNLELSVMVKEVLVYLDTLRATVKRCYVGAFVTSIEMAGVSITLMILNSDRLKYLDAYCECTVWPQSGRINELNDFLISCDDSTTQSRVCDEKAEGIGIYLVTCLKEICNVLITNEEYLNSLDRAGGDGDTGTTFANLARSLLPKVSDAEHVRIPINSPHELLQALAREVEENMGGSSGALISLFLTSAVNGAKNDGKECWVQVLELGIAAMERYGGAGEGDRTMLDALHPALRALKACGGDSVSDYLDVLVEGAESGAKATVDMKAKAGRASYVSDVYLINIDPGAAAVALIFKSMRETCAALLR